MAKKDKAVKLLAKKVEDVNFEDEVYTLVFEMVTNIINDVEKELGDIDEENADECWYDDVREEMMDILYDRIGSWLTKQNWLHLWQ